MNVITYARAAGCLHRALTEYYRREYGLPEDRAEVLARDVLTEPRETALPESFAPDQRRELLIVAKYNAVRDLPEVVSEALVRLAEWPADLVCFNQVIERHGCL